MCKPLHRSKFKNLVKNITVLCEVHWISISSIQYRLFKLHHFQIKFAKKGRVWMRCCRSSATIFRTWQNLARVWLNAIRVYKQVNLQQVVWFFQFCETIGVICYQILDIQFVWCVNVESECIMHCGSCLEPRLRSFPHRHRRRGQIHESLHVWLHTRACARRFCGLLRCCIDISNRSKYF